MDENEPQEVATEAEAEDTSTEDEATEDTTEDAPQPPKREETLEQRRSRLQRELKQTEKKLGVPDEKPNLVKTHTGELDETQLLVLDTKGISEEEDIDLIQNVMQRTGQSLPQVLKDEYVTSKLAANAKTRQVSDATPSSTRRGGAVSVNLDALIAKAERTGEMPADFETRVKVVEALAAKTNPNKPRWHRG